MDRVQSGGFLVDNDGGSRVIADGRSQVGARVHPRHVDSRRSGTSRGDRDGRGGGSTTGNTWQGSFVTDGTSMALLVGLPGQDDMRRGENCSITDRL